MEQKTGKICLAELRIMEVLWEHGELPASQIYRILQDKIGWKKSTSYTVVGKCIEKGFIERTEPHFVCRARFSREEMQVGVIEEYADLYFGGSKKQLLLAFLKHTDLTAEEMQSFKKLLEVYK